MPKFLYPFTVCVFNRRKEKFLVFFKRIQRTTRNMTRTEKNTEENWCTTCVTLSKLCCLLQRSYCVTLINRKYDVNDLITTYREKGNSNNNKKKSVPHKRNRRVHMKLFTYISIPLCSTSQTIGSRSIWHMRSSETDLDVIIIQSNHNKTITIAKYVRKCIWQRRDKNVAYSITSLQSYQLICGACGT